MSSARTGMIPPRVLNSGILVDEDLRRRTRAVTAVVGTRRAPTLLGVGRQTLDAVREGGRVQPETRDRLLKALDRAELELRLSEAS